jgi:shikimate kinase
VSIFLIGPRASGKTTVARLIAGQLQWTAIDADEMIEQRSGQSIQEIFASEGEQGFRDRESCLLAELCGLPGHRAPAGELSNRSSETSPPPAGHVVSTGGGVVLRESNRDLLRRSGWVVWLTADVDTLWQRLQGDPATAGRRPVLTVGGREEVAQLLRVREPLYRACAHLMVQTAGRGPEEIAAEILAAHASRSRTADPTEPSS